jgi:SnoaL-like domain
MAGVSGEINREDVEAIERLIYVSGWLTDHGRADELPGTLAADGTVHGLGPKPMDHTAFTEWAKARAANTARRTRHQIGNVHLTAMPDGRVRGTAVVVIWATEGNAPPQAGFVGNWEDIFVRTADGRWLIQQRRLTSIADGG